MVLCSVSLAACMDTASLLPESEGARTVDPSTDELAQRIVAMGFHPEMIVDRGDYYLVEGDIAITKEQLRSQGESISGVLYQWTANHLPSQSVVAGGISVDISGIAHNSGWLAAARQAMHSWSIMPGTKVKFHEVDGSPAHVTLVFDSQLNDVAVASYPSGGLPGPTIWISTNAGGLAASRKHWVMVHELGHVIGFRHTDWQEREEWKLPGHSDLGVVHVPGTPVWNDAASVMRTAGSQPPIWSGFSFYDQVAMRSVFPAPSPSVASGYQGDAPSISWIAVPDAVQYRIFYWYNVDDWIYDPTYPGGGYYAPITFSEDRGLVSGTTFVDTIRLRTWDDSCFAHYTVAPVYPSGKEGARGDSGYFDNCF